MWCRTCSLLLCLAACGSGDHRRIDVCGRGDRSQLAAALEGGRFRVEALDGVGEVIAATETPSDGARAVDLGLGGAASVRVVGVDVAGGEVASGFSAVGSSDVCVCFALDPQRAAACDGLVCRVEGGECRFFDAADGEPAGSRTLDLVPVADATAGGEGGAPSLEAGVALMRFDATVLPRATVIDAAWLELPIGGAGGPVAIDRVLDPWSEDASDAVSYDPAPVARFYADEDRTVLTFDATVSAWLRDPATNYGLALVGEGTVTALASREAPDPPRLSLRYHMAGDSGVLVTTTHPCGDGVLDAAGAEECDDADDDDQDGCTNACLVARCGDNVIRRHVEDCDDGNATADDGCSADCLRCDDPAATATYLGQNGHCYAWYATPGRSFPTAENMCDFTGHGVVASFETLAEQTEVVTGLGLTGSTVWIGLTDRGTEGDYRWVSGGPTVAYTDWAAMEPTGAAEDCVTLNGNANWVDDLCSDGHGFICERTPWLLGADGHAYRPVAGAGLDFVVASSDCQTIGAELMTLSDDAENALVAGAIGFDSWMGLTESGHEGSLAWASGEAFSYENFSAGIPNLDGAEFCVRLQTSGSWALSACANNSRYVCESR